MPIGIGKFVPVTSSVAPMILDLSLQIPYNPTGAPSWVPKDQFGNPALFVIDGSNDRGWFDGLVYSETALLLATNGTKSGITTQIGPYLAPNATELFPNGGMEGGYAGWTNGNSGIGSVVGGELQLDGNGGTNPQAVSPAVTTVDGQCYQFGAKYRRGTSTSGAAIISGAGLSLSPSIASLPTNATGVDVINTETLSAEGVNTYLGLRSAGSGITGTVFADDFTLKLVNPLDKWVAREAGVIMDFVTPAAVASIKTLCSLESKKVTAAGARSIWKVYIDTDLHMKVSLTARGTLRATMDLGVVGTNTAHRIHMSLTGLTCFAQLDDNLPAIAGTVVPMGAAVIRGARSGAGEIWDGSDPKITVFNKSYVPQRSLLFAGDSYAAGVNGAGMSAGMTAAGRPASITISEGGTSLVTQLALLEANQSYTNGVLVWWDGDANNYQSTAADMAIYAQGIALMGSQRFIIIPSCLRNNVTGGQRTATIDRSNAIKATYPNNYFDAQAYLATLSDGSPADVAAVAAGNIPPSCLQVDEVHLTVTAMNSVMAQVKAFLDVKGL